MCWATISSPPPLERLGNYQGYSKLLQIFLCILNPLGSGAVAGKQLAISHASKHQILFANAKAYDGIGASNLVNFIVGKIDAEPQTANVYDEKLTCFFFGDREAKCVDPETPCTMEVKVSLSLRMNIARTSSTYGAAQR